MFFNGCIGFKLFILKHIQRGARQGPVLQRPDQGCRILCFSPATIDKKRACFLKSKKTISCQMKGFLRQRNMQADYIGIPPQLIHDWLP